MAHDAEYYREYYAAHEEHIKAQKKAWYERNRDDQLAKSKYRYRTTREERRQDAKLDYCLNREARRLEGNASYQRHKEKRAQTRKEWRTWWRRHGIELLGGQCEHCGFDGNMAAFDFHHVDPSIKEFDLTKRMDRTPNKAVNVEAFDVELAKCALLCRNCHAIEHWSDEN